jgi:hypothetical protein
MLVERLSIQTGLSVSSLLDFARAAGRMYKMFEIPKRSGGTRLIEQPAKSVKAMQRWLIRSLLSKYSVHPSAIGYRASRSIRDNALPHTGFRYSLRMDFKDFFWSFRSEDVERFLRRVQLEGIVLSDIDIAFVVAVVSRQGRLVMGAPSSPALTNAMMYDLDYEIAGVARNYSAIYTRYADDLFLSSDIVGQSELLRAKVMTCVREADLPHLQINTDKTLYLSKKHHREITGLVVTPQGNVSLGRHRKKMIRSLIHSALLDKLDGARHGQLAGYINWAASVEPAFLESLERKYGAPDVARLRLYRRRSAQR